MTAVVAAVPVGIGLALAALPIVLIPVTLAAKRPPGVARAFLGGWLVGVVAVTLAVVLLADVLVLPTGDPRWLGGLKVVLGVLLVVLGVKQWLGRPRAGDTPETPGWMARTESMSGAGAFGLGLLLASVNPKNLVLVVNGATVIADGTAVLSEQLVAIAVFAVVSSIGVGAPVVLTITLGTRANEVLAAVDGWMTRYSAVIVAVVMVVLGAVVAVNGITALAG